MGFKPPLPLGIFYNPPQSGYGYFVDQDNAEYSLLKLAILW